MYVFYHDSSLGSTEGRLGGEKVARAPITDNGIDPGSFVTYFQGNFTDKALPNGFGPANIMNFFSQKGGRSTSLFANDTSLGHLPDVFSFSAAHLKGTNLYLGVAQDLYLGTTLRLSSDLVNWGKQIVIPGTEFNYYTNGGTPAFIKQPFMYPKLISSDGDSNTEIDPSDFYVIGTTRATNPFNPSVDAQIVDQVHIKLTLPVVTPTPIPICGGFAGATCPPAYRCVYPPGSPYPDQSGSCVLGTPTPSPTPILGDVNGDGKVDIIDIGIVIENYGKKPPPNPKADINHDGIVDIIDMGIIINNYQK
jgi:hypothetical protein